MAGPYGPSSVGVTLTDSPGGTPRDIEDFILNGVSASDISEVMESTGLGDSSRERMPIGMLDSETQTLTGKWDTTGTTGTHAVMAIAAGDYAPASVGREIVITFGDSKTWTRSYHMTGYKVLAQPGSIQMFEAELTPTGAAVWGP